MVTRGMVIQSLCCRNPPVYVAVDATGEDFPAVSAGVPVGQFSGSYTTGRSPISDRDTVEPLMADAQCAGFTHDENHVDARVDLTENVVPLKALLARERPKMGKA